MRYMLGIAILAMLLLLAPIASDGKEPLDKPWAKSDGDFGVLLQLTDKPDELFADWEKQGKGVRISEAETATRGEPIVAVVIFTGCAPDANGNCQATVEYTAYGPDGKPYGEPVEAELWVDKRAPSQGQIQLSIGTLGIVLEPQDLLGVYKVQAKVVDQVANKTLLLEREFKAVEPDGT